MLLLLFVISLIGVVDDIGVIVVDIDGVTELDLGISTDESGWLILGSNSVLLSNQ